MLHEDDYPRSMRRADVRNRRAAMIGLPHVRPLTDFADDLRRKPNREVPNFDPLNGGIEARVLLLFEKPGPMTSIVGGRNRTGSGFISRNNDDPTAEATFEFTRQAGFLPCEVVFWNVVPWWDGSRKITSDQLRDGIESLKELVVLLPKLRVVILVGKRAAKAESHFADSNRFSVITSDHPSPLVKARWPGRWNAIPISWRRAREHLKQSDSTGPARRLLP